MKILALDPSVTVDEEDYERCAKIKWSLTNSGYMHGNFAGETVLLHRFVLWMFDDNKLKVDHRNGNKLDCRKHNLRIATTSQNGANQKSRRKYKGVSWHNRDQIWRARIKVNYKEKCLGYFKLQVDAARAYNNAAVYYFGEFAKLNLL